MQSLPIHTPTFSDDSFRQIIELEVENSSSGKESTKSLDNETNQNSLETSNVSIPSRVSAFKLLLDSVVSENHFFLHAVNPIINPIKRFVSNLTFSAEALKKIFFYGLSFVYEIFLNCFNFIDKLLYGYTFDELKKEVLLAQQRGVEIEKKRVDLKGKFENSSNFLENFESLENLRNSAQDNLKSLTEKRFYSFSLFELVHFHCPEEVVSDSSNPEEGSLAILLDGIIQKEENLLRELELLFLKNRELFEAYYVENCKKECKEDKEKLLKVWHRFMSGMTIEHKYEFAEEIKQIENKIRKHFKINEKSVSLIPLAPSNLLNNQHSSCYIASVLQIVLAEPSLRQQIVREIPKPTRSDQQEEYQGKVAIQRALLKFMIDSSSKQTDEEDEKYFLYSRNPLSELREAIFNSPFQKGEFHMGNFESQLDAASILELLSSLFFKECQFDMPYVIKVDKYPDLEVHGLDKDFGILQVPLKLKKDQNKYCFDDLFNFVISEEETHEGFTLDPSSQSIRSKPNSLLPTSSEKFNSFKVKRSLSSLPPLLLTHFKRFTAQKVKTESGESKCIGVKIEAPIELTANGLSSFSDAESRKFMYKLKSFVVHKIKEEETRDINGGGHYTSYVQIQGKYYFCDDLLPNCYTEVLETTFLSASQDAYLCIWEKMSTEQEKGEVKKTNQSSDTILASEQKDSILVSG